MAMSHVIGLAEKIPLQALFRISFQRAALVLILA